MNILNDVNIYFIVMVYIGIFMFYVHKEDFGQSEYFLTDGLLYEKFSHSFNDNKKLFINNH